MAILFPRPFAIAVDDLGWNDGSDLTKTTEGGPYRCGIDRTFTVQDYHVFIRVGQAVGTRIQCAFILSEMDRENILANFPTTTHLRDRWDNSFRVNDEQLTIMNFVKEQSAYMEFGLHGVGHEYWASEEPQKRAEWYNLFDKQPWPESSLREHIECFRAIMAQYGITKESGHSFPESFVPCAYSYYWNPDGEYSLGKLLRNAGIKYANTDFSMIPELNPPSQPNDGGFDHGVHVINRINYGNLWDAVATLPVVPPEQQETDIIESHWPNWLAHDPADQESVTKDWINYYRQIQALENRYIAKNTEQLHSQWLYNCYAQVSESADGFVQIDNTEMPGEVYKSSLLGNMVLKVKLGANEHISSATLNQQPLGALFEDAGYGFLYVPPLEKKKYELRYSIGSALPDTHILMDGTYNVYHFESIKNKIRMKLKIYGSQTLRIRCDKPADVSVAQGNIQLGSSTYNMETGYLEVNLAATDMQGDTGALVIIQQ